MPIYFSGGGSRDADPKFEGMSDPDPNSPNWNGITSYTWNFGDASPISSGENIWHTFTVPGSYLVSLTVRDGYGTGDTNQTHRMIHVSSPPTILVDSLFEEEIDLGSSVVLILSYEDEDIKSGISAFRDTDIMSDSDSDGILTTIQIKLSTIISDYFGTSTPLSMIMEMEISKMIGLSLQKYLLFAGTNPENILLLQWFVTIQMHAQSKHSKSK